MRNKLIALKLFLEELGVPSDIGSVDERKRVQKSIYIGQAAKIDLGYHFAWYLKGPYSPELTKDYYELDEVISEGDLEFQKKELKGQLKEKLLSIKPLFTPPADTPLNQADWLELLASVHYQLKKYDRENAKNNMVAEKPNLAPYFKIAEENLKVFHLLNN
jgi:uncharacterized protein YwgA